MITTNKALQIAVDALLDKKGDNLKVIDISKISVISDCFVIISGKNVNQIHAMADEVEEKLAHEDVHPKIIEGYNSAGWILLDYNDFIIHIFNEDQRVFYDIERLWSDGIDITSSFE